jgi:hypothetical protein
MTRARLDPQLKKAIAAGTPVEVVDPATNDVYYLLSTAQFQAAVRADTDDLDPQQAYPLVEMVMAEDDAGDPLLDSYGGR